MNDPGAAEADYQALLAGAAALDLAGWTLIRLQGPDAPSFLQGLASQDLARLGTGEAATTLFLTERGRPVCLAWVAASVDRAEPDAAVAAGAPPGGAPRRRFYVMADEGARATLPAHLRRFRVMEDVELEEIGETPRLVGVAGPDRDRIVADAGGVILGAEAIRGDPLSFLLLSSEVPAISLPPFAAGPAVEAWRLRVGLPRTGVDLDPERIATELSLGDAISHSKGCYVGQEVVARTSGRGHVRRQRIGFRFAWDGPAIPRGAELRAGEAPAGYVTSTAREPGSGDGLGMGYVTADALASGGPIAAVAGSRVVPVRPGSWPV